jgi:DNA polymerase-1
MKRLFLLDGSALMYRAFFALQEAGLTNDRGEPTAAVLGFANTLHMLVKQESPEFLAVVFDSPGPTFRHEKFPEYKATRARMPDELRTQIPWVKELVERWPCPRIEVPGIEADDVIGAYAAQVAGPELEVVAVTGDKDFYQLLSEHVRILNPGRGGAAAVQAQLIGPDDIRAKFGVDEPRQVIDVLALMGDQSDNIPGVPGIGPKTAAKLIGDYGTLDGVYANLGKLRESLAGKLEAHRGQAFLSRDLVTIRTDIELPAGLDALAAHPPGGDALFRFLDRMNFERLKKELGGGRTPSASAPATLFGRHDSYVLVSDGPGLERLARRLAGAGSGFALHAVTGDGHPLRAALAGIAAAPAPGEAYYVNVGHETGTPPLSPDAVREQLGPVLADPAIPKLGHNAKVDLQVLGRAGLPVRGLAFDTLIAAYLIDPEGAHGLEALARQVLDEPPLTAESVAGKGAKRTAMTALPAQDVLAFAGESADAVLRLHRVLDGKLEASGLGSLFRDVEMPLLHVLGRMEETGVALDVPFLRAMSTRLTAELERLETRAHDAAGETFNIGSPPQLAEVLFHRLALPRGRRTKTGFSTDSEVLEGLRPHHPLPGVVLEYRQLAKLKSTYVDTLPAMIHPDTGRVHASFNQTVAATGRLSSSDPNLQNIPIRTPLGREVRKAFIPGEPGWVLVSADYSQIELRIMAHLSRDPALLEAFARGADVHTDTASRIFGVPAEAVTERQRGQAKTVNFGVLYGQGPFGLSRTLGITTQEATAFIKAYKSQYAGVMAYLEGTLAAARRTGYVTTLLNRRRYLPGLRQKSGPARGAAERLAVNTPIQGSAADLIKVAMVQLHRHLEASGLRARLLLQVHDELVLECPASEGGEVEAVVRRIMEGALHLDVPVVVNVGSGSNWAEIH